MQLWPHQSRALAEIRQAISEGHRRIVVASPTGSGKTTMAAEILRLTVERGGKGLFVVHRNEICLDARARLERHNLDVGVIAPGHPSRPHADVQCCSTQTMLSRMVHVPGVNVIIADEFHHYAEKVTWTKIFQLYPDAILIGFTATPSRGDNQPLDGVATKLIVAAQYSELIAEGRIVHCRVYVPARELDSESNEIALSPLAAYQQHTPGRKGFCFTKTVAHSEQLAAEFNAAGIPSAVISAKTSKRNRREYFEQFKSGVIRVLMNAAVLTEGIDVADAEVCILVRNPDHVGSYLQMVGRVLRASPGKTHAVLLDLYGACKRHGLPDDDRVYSLDGGGGAISAGSSVKQCPGCAAFVSVGAKSCPHCGYVFSGDPTERAIVPTDAKVGLVEHSVSVADERARLEPLFKATIEAAKKTGAPLLWALGQFRSEHCKTGIPGYLLTQVSPEDRKQSYDRVFADMLRNASYKGRVAKFGYAAACYKEIFGSWPPMSWGAAWRAKYDEVAARLRGTDARV